MKASVIVLGLLAAVALAPAIVLAEPTPTPTMMDTCIHAAILYGAVAEQRDVGTDPSKAEEFLVGKGIKPLLAHKVVIEVYVKDASMAPKEVYLNFVKTECSKSANQ
jgi:hypothetical protein